MCATQSSSSALMHQDEVLLVHGLGCQGTVWDPLRAYLDARGMICHAPTLLKAHRPKRLSELKAPAKGLDEFVSEVRSLCRASTSRTGRPPVVIGHSMGGLIAQIVAAEGLCTKAVFLAPAPPKAIPNRSPWMLWCFANVLFSGDTARFHKAWRRGARDVLLYPLSKRRQDRALRDMVYEPGQLFADMTKGIDIAPDSLRIPTLTVAAGRDRAVPATVVRRIAEYYSVSPVPSTFRMYPRSGHWLLDDPHSAELYGDLADWIEASSATVPSTVSL
ncbi:hypothetical protein RLO149_c016680 [Roseobacter litoralis Och 149]|uniref:AB hydrolase-1 domain-containing protein n=2 Tax=Roseobacter litoralis TaxID=42443 RepID=F7ZHQ0_ROSLO|nr:hypothetical protein RLO149_c016680 [Roseobacter litoralis Och 149]